MAGHEDQAAFALFDGARLPVPGRQVVEAVDFVIRQAVQEIGDIGLGIEIVGLCRLDDGHDGRGVFGAAVGTSKHPVLPADTQRAHGALGDIVIDGNGRVVEKQGEGIPFR